MFTYFSTLWHQLQCPYPMEMLQEAYEHEQSADAIAYLDKWLPYLSEYNKMELFKQMSWDLWDFIEPGEYNDTLFEWLEANNPM